MAIDIYGDQKPTTKLPTSPRPLEQAAAQTSPTTAPSPAASQGVSPGKETPKLSLEKDYSGDEESSEVTMGTEYPYYANTGQVMLGYVGTGAPTGSPRPVYSNVYEQEQYLKSLRGAASKDSQARKEYESIITLLRNRGYLGARSRATTENVDSAWKDLLEDSNLALEQGYSTTPLDILTGGGADPEGTGVGSFGSGGASSRSTSVSLSSPEDVETALQEAARDMIGRVLTDEELAKYTKRYQRQEAAAVTTTTRTPGGTVTELGTSKEEILRRIMTDNPDFATYQIDTNFMDMFVDSIREGQAVINAGR